MERIEGIQARLDALEKTSERLERSQQSAVEEIKDTIRTEIRELKEEQISDLRRDIRATSDRLDKQGGRLDLLQRKMDQWDTARGLVNWLIRFVIAAAAAFGGYLAEHARHP